LRPNLNQWFAAQQIKPRIVAEFDDFSLLRVFTTAGHGVCAAPVVLDAELRRVHRLQRIGQAENLRARFYAISVDRRISQPAVVAICERARAKLYG
jgi:LysR family transcriptional activator of nhaA